MSRVIIVPGADASGRGQSAVSIESFDREIGRIPGLIHLLDPAQVPGFAVNGASAQAFKDRVRGRPLRASPGRGPIIATEAGVAASRPLFDVSNISECDLTAQDPTYPVSGMTFVGLFRPTPASIGGSFDSFLLRALEGSTGRLSFFVTSGAPTLLLRDDTANTGAGWSFGANLTPGVPVVLAFTMDFATKTLAIYCNNGIVPVAISTVSALGSYPGANFTFLGAKQASGSWRGRGGRQAVWKRALLPAEMRLVMEQWRNYYGVLV